MGEVRDLFSRTTDVPAEVAAAAKKRAELQGVLDRITPASVLRMREPAISTAIIIDKATQATEAAKGGEIPTNLAHVDLKRITDPAQGVKPLIFHTVTQQLAGKGIVLAELQIAALNNYIHQQRSGILDRQASGLGTGSARELAQTADIRAAIGDKKQELLTTQLGPQATQLVDALHHELRSTWTATNSEEARKLQAEGADKLASELGTRFSGSTFLDASQMIDRIMSPIKQAAGTISLSQRRADKALLDNKAALEKTAAHPVALSRLAADTDNQSLASAAQTEKERNTLLAQAGAQASMAYIETFIKNAAAKLPTPLA